MSDLEPDSRRYFHGTDDESAVDLVRNGIRGPALQQRDRGFFGEGFYVTQRFVHATNYGRSVVSVQFPRNVRIFPAHEIIGDGVRVTEGRLPDWYDKFFEWHLAGIRDAAVWERIPDVSRERVIRNAKDEVNPRSDDFDRLNFYPRVTEYAAERGYDIVTWNETENVVVDYDAPSAISPANDRAASAVREAGVPNP